MSRTLDDVPRDNVPRDEEARDDVPRSLLGWFSIHFVVDIVVGLPLLLVPELVLPRLGWLSVDAVTSRLLGAAMIALGWQALRARAAPRSTCRVLLRSMLVWSTAAIVGMLIAIGRGAPAAAWAVLSGFVASSGVCAHYAIRLRQMDDRRAPDGDGVGVGDGVGDGSAAETPFPEDAAADNDVATEDLGPRKTHS